MYSVNINNSVFCKYKQIWTIDFPWNISSWWEYRCLHVNAICSSAAHRNQQMFAFATGANECYSWMLYFVFSLSVVKWWHTFSLFSLSKLSRFNSLNLFTILYGSWWNLLFFFCGFDNPLVTWHKMMCAKTDRQRLLYAQMWNSHISSRFTCLFWTVNYLI